MFEEIGVDKVGVCLVFLIILNGIVDDNFEEIYFVIVFMFNSFKIGYMYIVEVDWDDVL